MTDESESETARLVKLMVSEAANKEAAAKSLALLFPSAERTLKTYANIDRQGGAERHRRIANREFTASYFSLEPTFKSWRKSDFTRLLASGAEGVFDSLADEISVFPSDQQKILLKSFLDELRNEIGRSIPITSQWLTSVFHFAPQIFAMEADSEREAFGVSNANRLEWLAIEMLERAPNSERGDLFLTAVSQTSDLSLPCSIFRTIEGDINPEGASKNRHRAASLGEQSNQIRIDLLDKVRGVANSGCLWTQARPRWILWFWWGCDVESEVRAFIAKNLHQASTLRSLADAMISIVSSSSGNYFSVNLESWQRLVDIDRLLKSLEGAQLDTPTTEDKMILSQFKQAIENGRHF